MESLKELIDRRNKAIADAREILSAAKPGETLAADRQQKADELLDLAGTLDEQIRARQQDGSRRDRLAALEARLAEPAPRQVPAVQPGLVAPRGGDGASLDGVVKLGRGKKAPELRFAPGTPQHERCGLAYRQAFGQYLLTGRAEGLSLQVGKDTKGGYLAPMTFSAKLIMFLSDFVFMRQLATVLPPLANSASLGVPSWDTDPNDADWSAEVPASDITEDDNITVGRREFIPHLLTKLVKFSTKLLRNSVIDIEDFAVGRIGYKYGITEEKAFLTGTGVQQPLGVFTASANGIDTSRDTACASTTAFTADELINVLYSLKEVYQRNATWLMSREGIKRARKLKDGNGQYIWQAGLQGGQPGMILERPYVMSEYVPSTYTTGKYVAAVGDWKACYWIVDGMDMEVQRLAELFSLRNQVGLLAHKETDGMPVLPEAAARLILA